ncbi:hypothetical protein GALL_374770 [mine drainage metagenome]|uniref:Uncharacterized protein n=1 Tax=mine drainage metagenome TaxID=410659 RepID=A0A1J5QAT1_9ZZZZ
MHRCGTAELRAVLVAARLAIAYAVDVGDSANWFSVKGNRSIGSIDKRLVFGKRENTFDAVSILTDFGVVSVKARGHHDGTDLRVDHFRPLAVDGHFGVVVSETSRFSGEFSVREYDDRRVAPDLCHEFGNNFAPILVVREHWTELSSPTSELVLPFHEIDAETKTGQADGGSKTRNAPTDHHRLRCRLYCKRYERQGLSSFRNRPFDQAYGLRRRTDRIIGVRP